MGKIGTITVDAQGVINLNSEDSDGLPLEIATVSAAKLQKTYTRAENKTLTDANTDYAAAGANASGDKYLAGMTSRC